MTENGNGKNGNYTAAQFIAAIQGSGGIVTTIAGRVHCAWHTAKRYCDRKSTPFPTVADAYEDECQKITDMAESVVIKDIRDGVVETAKWYLTMKGRDRGFTLVQKQELTGPNGGPIQTQETPPDFSKLSDDELDTYIAICGKLQTGEK